jgi:hypothetical protein
MLLLNRNLFMSDLWTKLANQARCVRIPNKNEIDNLPTQKAPYLALFESSFSCSDLARSPTDSVSKVEMASPMALTYKVLFPSLSTFETPLACHHLSLHSGGYPWSQAGRVSVAER